MEDKENKYSNLGENQADEQLERVLENLDGLEDRESEVKNKAKVKQRVFMQKDEMAVGKEGMFKDLAWYVGIIRKPVLVLAGLEILLYVLALFDSLKLVMTEVFDPILLLVDLIFFGWIAWQVRLKRGESLWQALVSVFLAGFGVGLIMSIFKAVWIREYWTIFNLITEPVFMGLVAVVVGLVVGLAIGRQKTKA